MATTHMAVIGGVPGRRAVACAVSMAWLLYATTPAIAVEGLVAAGPIGSSDIRSALLPPPGLYAGTVGLYSAVTAVVGSNGQPVPVLDKVDLSARMSGGFLGYVPEFRPFGGSTAAWGVLPVGQLCGQLVSQFPRQCRVSIGDPYIEADWVRGFGEIRASRDPGAFPIFEGVAILLGLGAVLPIGKYSAELQARNGVSIGNNTFDLAPSLAVTYTSPPILDEGTEASFKAYWNNYGSNPKTGYSPGNMVETDFAISEHIGRFQVGLNGIYQMQTEDDRRSGIRVAPDGNRFESFSLGAVINYDMPQLAAAIRLKTVSTVFARRSVKQHGAAVSLVWKLQ